MENIAVKVLLRQSWNNLCDLPTNVASLLYNANVSPQEVIIEIVNDSNQKYYIGWSGMTSSAVKSLGIDPLCAQSLSLSENDSIKLNLKIQNVKSSQIMLEPVSFTDWELVELHATHIESKLIEQSRCVAQNQILVIFPTKTSAVRLHVTNIGLDQPFALIDAYAEVSIAPKKHERVSSSTGSLSKANGEDDSPFASVLSRGISLPHPCLEKFADFSKLGGFVLYGNLKEMNSAFGVDDLVAVSVVAGPNSRANKGTSAHANSSRENSKGLEKYTPHSIVEGKQIIARLVCHSMLPKKQVFLSEKLAIALSVERLVGYKVFLKRVPNSASKRPSALVIHPFIMRGNKNEANFTNLFKSHSSEHSRKFVKQMFQGEIPHTTPVTNFCKVSKVAGLLPLGGIVTFKKISDPNAWFELSHLCQSQKSFKFELGEPVSCSVPDKQTRVCLQPHTLYGIQSLSDDVSGHVCAFRNTGLMIHGTQGSGKTAIMKHLEKRFRDEFSMFTMYVACETFMNESTDQVRLKISRWVNEATWNQPSVLILDNLDKLLSAKVENMDSSKSDQLTENFIFLLRIVSSQKDTNVSVLISGTSRESFNKLFLQSHLTEKYCKLTAPDKSTRAAILEEYIHHQLKCRLSFDLMDVVSETEGYLPNDLKVLSDRMLYESLRHSDPLSNQVLTRSNFKTSLDGFKPSSMRGVKLEKSGTHWDDIGGMCEAKRILLETLEWPTKYAPIFAHCPLRLRSGLLLYGYPGCGKTLLASAIASQCGLNFISIKGPEILNKYIGASEQSVRDLFERAQSARPCVLFFDEFDSIAPKRGHDSTGVTDRVVNQMLTQMDGAEGLDGVYILAATSRPDLIDSALLRPGRLDKSIFCDLPNYNDRLSILRCICSKMNTSKDFKLEEIADQTKGFSGADLQGLGYNAYLKAVHEKLSNDKVVSDKMAAKPLTFHEFFLLDSHKTRNKVKNSEISALQSRVQALVGSDRQNKDSAEIESRTRKTQVWIRQVHFRDSLRESKSSISASEKTKLSHVYTEFSTSRDGNMPDGSGSRSIGGRSTLM